MINLHALTYNKKKNISAFNNVAELGASTITNRIWYRHLINGCVESISTLNNIAHGFEDIYISMSYQGQGGELLEPVLYRVPPA